MTSSFRPNSFILPVILAGLGTITVASAQSSSPFAKKNKTQAWETAPAPAQPTAPSAPTYRTPLGNPAQAPNFPQTQSPTLSQPQTYRPQPAAPNPQTDWRGLKPATQPATPAQAGVYYPGRAHGGQTAHNVGAYESSARASSPQSPSQPAYNAPNQADWPAYQTGQYPDGQQPRHAQAQYQGGQGQPYQGRAYQGGAYQGGAYQGYGNGPNPVAKPKRSWKDRLGLGKLQTIFRGSAAVGAAAVENPNGAGGWDAEFIGDADLEFEVSAITQGGLEYGAVIGGRGQYDRFRRGFGQRLPDCPPTIAGCSAASINGVATGLRGHTSQFFSDGEDDARAEEAQLETAYLFLRSAYGDVTVGRDDGAAYLFSLGAPSLLKVGASNSPVDYTGFDSVKTVNDASGFAEKVTYTTPRLLGDTVGIGVQLGASYAPNARGCGVDYCVRSNERQGSGTVAADLRDVIEVGVALDRNFGNGLKAELTASYARADERSGFAGLDDLEAFNAGLELTYNDWVLGGSYLNSNNGLLDGDYEAYDVGLTWKPSRLGFTLGYGHAEDDNVNLTSDQAVFGITYDFDKITIGTGVQYIDRTTSVFDGAGITRQSEDATAIFIETGFKF